MFPGLLPRAIDQWPARWQDDFRERAAIKEYDGNMSRRQAVYEAEAEMRQLVAKEQK